MFSVVILSNQTSTPQCAWRQGYKSPLLASLCCSARLTSQHFVSGLLVNLHVLLLCFQSLQVLGSSPFKEPMQDGLFSWNFLPGFLGHKNMFPTKVSWLQVAPRTSPWYSLKDLFVLCSTCTVINTRVTRKDILPCKCNPFRVNCLNSYCY